MKHIFVINPAAGKENAFDKLCARLADGEFSLDYEVYRTQAPGDATSYIRALCAEHPEEDFRFYACGGDGTLNEVVSGAVGFANASVGCYPCGSGNDFVKYYGGADRFLDLSAQANAVEEKIDVIQVGDRYAINAVHFGFDSRVAETVERVRRKAIIGGSNAYRTGVIVGLLKGMKNKCRVTVDGELLNAAGTILLCTIANGQYVGGSYRCAPRSLDNDGLLEVCLVHPVSRLKFVSLVKYYTEGTHLDNPKFDKVLVYRRGREIEVEGPDGFAFSMDGELVYRNKFTVRVLPGALRFAVPPKK